MILLINTILAELEKFGATTEMVQIGGQIIRGCLACRQCFKNRMVMAGSTYWNFGIGLDSGEVAKDDEGMENIWNIAANIAWLYTKIRPDEKQDSCEQVRTLRSFSNAVRLYNS